MSRVFVTGGAGYIGGALARALAARGDEVVALAHTDAAERTLNQMEVKVVRGDLLEPEALAEGMAGCEVAYHVAAVNSHCPKDPEHLVRVNVVGTENVAREAARAGLRRLVFTSSSATVGEPEGTVGTEKTPHRGTYLSLYERSKHDAERLAFEIGAENGLEVLALNPSSVQGPPRIGGNGALVIAFLNGRLRAFVETHVSVVDVRDVVEAHILAAESGEAGKRYILNGTTLPSRDLIGVVSRVAGIDDRVVMLPRGLVRGVATVAERAFGLAGRVSPFCRARVDTILHGHRYDGSLAARELGFEYTSVEETFRELAEWAVREGHVTRELPGIDTGDGKIASRHASP